MGQIFIPSWEMDILFLTLSDGGEVLMLEPSLFQSGAIQNSPLSVHRRPLK